MNSIQHISNYIIKTIIDNMDEEIAINWDYPKTKVEVKKWKKAIKNINCALEYNLYSYKRYIGENLSKYQRAFLEHNKNYDGLYFMPYKIYYINKILDKIKIHLSKIYNLLPYQLNSIFYNQTAESATNLAKKT